MKFFIDACKNVLTVFGHMLSFAFCLIYFVTLGTYAVLMDVQICNIKIEKNNLLYLTVNCFSRANQILIFCTLIPRKQKFRTKADLTLNGFEDFARICKITRADSEFYVSLV